jgi:hypothetical protein
LGSSLKKRRVLATLADGAPRAASRVRLESQCSNEDLLALANGGFVRFRTEATGDLKVCVTPKGAEYLARQNAKLTVG